MKNLFVLVLAAVTLVSCNNVEQHRTAIEEVSTMWSDFNPKMDALSQKCATLNSSLKAMGSMVVEVTEDMDEGAVEAAQSINKEYKESAMKVTSMTEEVNTFVTGMMVNDTKVQSLVDGLAAGKIDGDVDAMIAEVKLTMEEATAKMEVYYTQLEEFSTVVMQLSEKMTPVTTEDSMSAEM